MPTTIKIKNGSGAPTSSDLVQGELAIDLTNKRLYTEDGSANILELGTSPSTIDINAGTIDGVTLGTNSAVTEAQIDNININGNAITSTDTNGNIAITPNGTGEVDISKVDINGGTIDGTVIGGASAAAGTFTTIAGTQFSSDATDVELKYSGSTKLATTNTGIDVTGTVTADGLTIEGSSAEITLSDTDSSGDAVINSNNFGSLILRADPTNAQSGSSIRLDVDGTQRMEIDNNGDISFYEDTGTTPKLFWDASAESLGIGTSSPVGLLDVVSSGSGVIRARSSTGSGAVGFQAQNSDTGTTALDGTFFGIDGSEQAYVYNYENSPLIFGTNNAERMRITSAGNVGIGTTSPGARIEATASGAAVQILNRTTSDGNILEFEKDGTKVGSIGTAGGGYPYIAAPANFSLMLGSVEVLPRSNTGIYNEDGTITLGASNARFKDLYLSGGVYLGGTGAANHLDDYEEGTFTPTVVGSTSAGTGIYSDQVGSYTKVGRLVNVNIKLNWSAHTGTGNLRIAGLPFTAGTNHVASLFANGLTYTGTHLQPFTSGTEIWLNQTTSGGTDSYIPMDTSCQMIITLVYYT